MEWEQVAFGALGYIGISVAQALQRYLANGRSGMGAFASWQYATLTIVMSACAGLFATLILEGAGGSNRVAFVLGASMQQVLQNLARSASEGEVVSPTSPPSARNAPPEALAHKGTGRGRRKRK